MGAILVSCKVLWGRLWAFSCTRKVVVYLCEPGTQRHARIRNTGGVTTTNKQFSSWPVEMGAILVSCKALWGRLWAVPCTHRGGVYLRQPGTQRHARIRNTGGLTTTNKQFSSWPVEMGAILVSCKALWGRQWAVPCTHRGGVYLRQPGTQRHARIRNTGGLTTTTKHFQAHQGRWVPFLWVAKHFEADSELFHVPTGEVCTCANQGPNVTRGSGTLGVWPQLISSFQADQWRWVPFLWVAKHFEADSELFHVPTGEVCTCANQGPNVTRGSGTLGVWPQLLSTFKLTRGEGCHSCELQSTLRQTMSCSMYPQGRCVPAPTRDPTSRADPEHWGCDHNY